MNHGITALVFTMTIIFGGMLVAIGYAIADYL